MKAVTLHVLQKKSQGQQKYTVGGIGVLCVYGRGGSLAFSDWLFAQIGCVRDIKQEVLAVTTFVHADAHAVYSRSCSAYDIHAFMQI